jgi:hypothetical protein
MTGVIRMRRVTDIHTTATRPGDFELYTPDKSNKRGQLFFICPKNRTCGICIRYGEFKDGQPRRWGFNGDADIPTLTPSIDCRGPSGCGWRGFIHGGIMTTVGGHT